MMGYFNIIDSLNDVKVNEGMTESIPKNKNKDSDKLVKALLSSDIDFISDKYINSYKSFYNRSSFSKNFAGDVIKWTSNLKNKNSNNGKKLYMLCLSDNGRFIMVFEKVGLARCFVFKVPDEATMESIFELANDGKMTFDVKNPKLDGCKLVADTYCIHGADEVDFYNGRIDKYNTRLLSDTVVVMEAMFNSLIYAFKRTYKNNYDSVVKEIANSCVNYEISLTEDDFVITFDFGGARECNRIEKFLFDKMGVGYCYIWKDGKSKIKLS